mgnify:CR=1 FL=1
MENGAINFENIYTKHIAPTIEEIEVKRQKLLKAKYIGIIVIWLAIVPISYAILIKLQAGYNAPFIGIFSHFAYITFIKSLYQFDIKEKLFAKISLVLPDIQYNHQYNADPDFIRNLEITPEFDYMFSSDTISGKHANQKFQKSTVNVFKGYMLKVDLKKELYATTIIKSKVMFQMNLEIFSGKQEVVLEDPKFSKYFKVTSTDQLEARKLLTAKLMERLNNLSTILQTQSSLSNKFQGNVLEYLQAKTQKLFEPVVKAGRLSCVFYKNEMIMLIPKDYELYEYKKLSIPADKTMYDTFIKDIQCIYSIIDLLP